MRNNSYPKRNPIKDYFPLPNEIFCLGLSCDEIAVYSYLLYCENRKNFKCHPSYKTIGQTLCMSRNTVCKYIRQLEEKELILTEPTNVFTKDGIEKSSPPQMAFYSRFRSTANPLWRSCIRCFRVLRICLWSDMWSFLA